jgi:hypothetical protein
MITAVRMALHNTDIRTHIPLDSQPDAAFHPSEAELTDEEDLNPDEAQFFSTLETAEAEAITEAAEGLESDEDMEEDNTDESSSESGSESESSEEEEEEEDTDDDADAEDDNEAKAYPDDGETYEEGDGHYGGL